MNIHISKTKEQDMMDTITSEDGVVWGKAKELYNEGTRAYHNFQHAIDVLRRVEEVEKNIGFMNYEAARLAALFHDAVYVVGEIGNEAASAVALKRFILDTFTLNDDLGACIDKAADLIMATELHMAHQRFFTDWDTVLFMDCDVLGFAKDPEQFKIQNTDIEIEFRASSKFDPDKFKLSQVKFLSDLYAKGVFRSPYFYKSCEVKALANIRSALADLGVSLA